MSKSTRRRSRALVLAMPDQTVTVLTYTAGVLFAVYLAFVIVTITFATMQTSLAAQVRELEGSITELERTYYAALAQENTQSPAAAGLVRPDVVEYAVEKPAPGISFARN